MTRVLISSAVVASVLLTWAKPAGAQGCRDYFAAEWGEPLDMSESTDIPLSFPVYEQSQLGPYSFSNGIFSTTTTGNDPGFRLLIRAVPGSIPDRTTRYADLHPVEGGTYNQMTIRMSTDVASLLQVFWELQNGTVGSSAAVPTQAGTGTYTVSLPWGDNRIFSIRVDPTQASGARLDIDYIYLTPAGCSDPDLRVAPIVQPDREGGEDFFVAVKGNPANFDSISDIDATGGHSAAALYSSSSYTDSAGAVKRGDYLEATNSNGNFDPTVHLVFPGSPYRIDASRYKIACYTLDILLPLTQFHSVVRLLWRLGEDNQTTDDVLTRITGEARYCLRMETVPLEPSLPSGETHPWRNNSSGEGIDLFRFDAHEDTPSVAYRLSDIRLSADHEADSAFAIVVSGSRSNAVELLYRKDAGALTPITTLPVNRNSDVYVWNTAGLASGSYAIFSRTGLNTLEGGGPVIVEHSVRAADSTAPLLHVDVPLDGYQTETFLQITGNALDNRRIAAVEAAIDGQLVDSFRPSNFDARPRDAYPGLPFTSEAGFDRFVDTSGLTPGTHTFTLTAYDTAGNTTVHTATIVKGQGQTAAFSVPFTQSGNVSVPDGVLPRGTPTPGGGSVPRPKVSARVSGANLSVRITPPAGTCSEMRLLASSGARTAAAIRANGVVLFSAVNTGAVRTGQAKGLPRVVPRRGGATGVNFLAECIGNTSASLASINGSRINGRRSVRTPARLLQAIRKRLAVR